MSGFAEALIYIIQTLGSLYLLIVLLRFILQLVRADFYNPLSQFTKHVQDDKSLQRDRLVGRGPGGMQEGMRSQQMGGPSDGVSWEQQPTTAGK